MTWSKKPFETARAEGHYQHGNDMVKSYSFENLPRGRDKRVRTLPKDLPNGTNPITNRASGERSRASNLKSLKGCAFSNLSFIL